MAVRQLAKQRKLALLFAQRVNSNKLANAGAGKFMTLEEKMTAQQAETEIENYRKLFQAVRLFPVDGTVPVREWCRAGQCACSSCDFEAMERECQNCVVKNAAEAKTEKGKLEVYGGVLHQIIARYLQIDGKDYIMELIRRLDNEWSFGQLNHENLVDLFVHYNDKLYKDAITDAYNRRYYEDEMKDRVLTAGVALVDLDDFKLYNDTYGHNAGDMALRTAADAIRKNTRKADCLIRLGGDEFLLLMPNIEEEVFTKKLELIKCRVHDATIPGYSKLQISISIGGTLCQNERLEAAVSRADHLMYQAKNNKNTVVTEQEDRESGRSGSGCKQKVLVVDDSEMNRAILVTMLETDFDIIEAENGEECLDLLKYYGKEVSVVLLDIVMPVMDGFEVLMEMNRKRWIEDIPVIMISSEESDTFIRRAFQLGVSDYISRPFDNRVVRQRVFNTIKLYAKQRRLIALVSNQIHENEKNSQMMVEVLSQIVEFRNGESGLHVLHIKILTEMLLEGILQRTDRYRLTPELCQMICIASAFHDIGKIGIDEKILNKPGRLTKEEFEIMKQHTLIGTSMLSKMERYKDEPLIEISYQICRWHHERYDGKGYPDGLVGDEIPISAQIVSLADVYDALVSERVYKKGFSHERAMEMILGGECGTFNPVLIQCFVEIQDKIKEKMAEIQQK